MCFKKCLFVLLVSTVFYTYGESNTWEDYTYKEETKSFYKIHNESKSWLDARDICESEDALLYYPDNREEAEMVKELTPDFRYVHIGVSDLKSEGNFETVDGKPINEVYNNWKSDQPDNVAGYEDCVEIIYHENLPLNDFRCDGKADHEEWQYIPFICKKKPSWKTTNSSCVYNTETGHCYSFHMQPLNWTDAETACRAQQSHLAVINSQKEADYFAEFTDNVPTNVLGVEKFVSGAVHLGFHNRDSRGWQTIQGTKLKDSGYALWGSYQPDGQGQEKCGSMFHNGHLNDINCDAECFYICEHEINNI